MKRIKTIALALGKLYVALTVAAFIKTVEFLSALAVLVWLISVGGLGLVVPLVFFGHIKTAMVALVGSAIVASRLSKVVIMHLEKFAKKNEK